MGLSKMKYNIKKYTFESRFDRKYWVSNTAKRNYFRFLKRYNNKRFRRILKKLLTNKY